MRKPFLLLAAFLLVAGLISCYHNSIIDKDDVISRVVTHSGRGENETTRTITNRDSLEALSKMLSHCREKVIIKAIIITKAKVILNSDTLAIAVNGNYIKTREDGWCKCRNNIEMYLKK